MKYPYLVLDHDDTVVQSETTVNYPFFCQILDQYRPGTTITEQAYMYGCYNLGFANMCREWYQFTEEELVSEYLGWKAYIKTHIPAIFPGMKELILRYKAAGGKIFVVSHSCAENITRDYMAHIGIVPDEIYGWDYPEHMRKPSVYPIEQLSQKYHCHPSQMLVVDDMKPAWEMARNAGCPIAFAGWGRQAFPEILEEMTRLCDYSFLSIEHFQEFLFS